MLGVALAMLANTRGRGIRVFRTLSEIPVATSAAVAAVTASVILDTQAGWLRVVLSKLGAIAPAEIFDVLADPTRALPAVSVPIIWAASARTFIIVLAALQSIPDDCLKRRASTVPDLGAVHRGDATVARADIAVPVNRWRHRRFLTFGENDLLHEAGRGSHERRRLRARIPAAFRSVDQGKAAAIAVLLSFTIVTPTAVQLALLRRRIHHAR